jgi:uncharacterized protein (TIGR02118 family)
MYRLSVLYGRPTDPETFDRYYREVHLPIASRMRGLTAWRLTWFRQQDGDMGVPPIHLVADMYAEDKAAMDAVLASLRDGGVASHDLRTTLLNLDAVRDWSDGSQRITGYQLSNTVEATVRAIEATGALVDAALAAGATSLDGLTFRLDDPTEALAEARRLAVADARQRAETLAAEAGVRLGPVVAIVEGGAVAPGPPRPTAMFRAKAEADAATPVETGTNELSIEVTVEFAIA